MSSETNKQWRTLRFPTNFIQPLPFGGGANKIIYTTRYEISSPSAGGIFEYNFKTNQHQTICLWSNINMYYPRWNAIIHSPVHHAIISVGGANVKQFHTVYDKIMLYDMNTRAMKLLDFDFAISANCKLALTNHDNYLHIIGGNQNSKHIVYNLATHESSTIHCFESTNPRIQEQALIFNEAADALMMFGGIQWSTKQQYDDFWMLDLSKTPQRVVDGYMRQTFLCHDTQSNYDVLANEIVVAYLGRDQYFSSWRKHDACKLPHALSGFGYVLYDHRIVIVFGGDTRSETSDSIWYLDTTKMDGWNECSVKMPHSGACHALLIESTVHILPYYDYGNYCCIDVSALLSDSLL